MLDEGWVGEGLCSLSRSCNIVPLRVWESKGKGRTLHEFGVSVDLEIITECKLVKKICSWKKCIVKDFYLKITHCSMARAKQCSWKLIFATNNYFLYDRWTKWNEQDVLS